MRSFRLIATVLSTAAIAVVVGGCGNSGAGLLTSNQADSISRSLDQIDSNVTAGDCPATIAESARLRAIIVGLPASVDPALKANLGQGAVTVADRAAADCSKTATTTSSTTTSRPTSSSSTSSSTTSSSTTTTTTTTPTTTSTTTPTTTTTTTGGGATPGA